jgi:hypothetical protein
MHAEAEPKDTPPWSFAKPADKVRGLFGAQATWRRRA